MVPVKSLSCHCSRDASSALLASFLAYGRQQLRGNQADNIVPEVQQSPEQMKVCATSEGTKSENAEISNPSTHQNDDSSASPSLATDSKGEEQKVLHRSQKRNRFRAKQRKHTGDKRGRGGRNPERSRASEKSVYEFHACGKSKKRNFLPLAQTVEIVSKNSCRGKSEVRGGKQDLQESS